jgi:hypothetical protein
MPDPLVLEDGAGEWVELYNPNAFPVNLYGWSLGASESGPAFVGVDVAIPPGGYAILSAGAPDRLGALGVSSAFQYQGLVLKAADRLLLVAPGGAVVDQAAWGDPAPAVAGTSLERSGWEPGAAWLNGWAAWPGGQGELGTPGRPYAPPPDLPATPLASGTPTPTPSATATPTPTPTVTVTPLLPPSFVWLHAAGASPLQIDEVAFEGEAGEYVVLVNTGASPVALTGWSLADAEAPGDSEAVLALPDAVLSPGAFFALARDGAAFQAQWGRAPDAQAGESAPAVPVLAARPGWGTGPFALNDQGDEVLLLDPAGNLADGVVYGDADPGAVGLAGALDPPAGLALQRVPGTAFPATLDQRHRFTAAPPDPFASVALPGGAAQQAAWLTDGLYAAWGSLGARSNFSAGRLAPPHLVAAQAAAAGLDFLALADPAPHAWLPAAPVTLLPAWSPPGGEDTPVVYSAQPGNMADTAALAAFVDAGDFPVQGWGAAPPEQVVAFDAGRLPLPGEPEAAFELWRQAGAPLLPAGNGDPAEAWDAPGQARFTGLAARDSSAGALEEALRARRGWLTSAPGLLLTLRAELPDGERVWMGQTVAPVNSLYLHVHYGDRAGQTARLEMWRNGEMVKLAEQPPVDGFWTVALPALPGDVFFALARQGDGDFALTAPVMVGPGAPVTLQLNEAYPLPTFDGNGDGVVDSDDEFIELYNPGVEPAPLEGWLLSDAAGDNQPGRRHAFAAGDFVPGQGRRLIWRSESHVNLNNDGDRLRLLRPDGGEVDGIAWDDSLAAGAAVARLPDGGAWQAGLPPSPGESNRAAPPPAVVAPAEASRAPVVGGWESTVGQADGPPGSVAFAKRMGVNAAVELRASVVVPPGLYTNAIYVGDLAADGILAHLGLRVYLPRGEFPELREGDQVVLRGVLKFYHGELELRVQKPEECRRIGQGAPLAPLPITPEEVSESVEGRFVTFVGAVSEVKGDSLYIADMAQPALPPVRVTVARSLEWSRPRAEPGQVWRVAGVVSQYATGSDSANSRSGYRVLVRWPNDLMRLRP